MPPTFCPSVIVWGDVATWIAGLATVTVGVLAWRTSRRATEIANEAKHIAEQQLDDAKRLRDERARIIGRLLHVEITLLPTRARAALIAMDKAIDWATGTVKNATALSASLDSFDESLLASSEQVEEQLHYLPQGIGADLATLIGYVRSLRQAASMIRAQAHQVQFPRAAVLFSGSSSQLQSFLKQQYALTDMAVTFAPEFQEFVGVPQRPYEQIRTELSRLRSTHGIALDV